MKAKIFITGSLFVFFLGLWLILSENNSFKKKIEVLFGANLTRHIASDEDQECYNNIVSNLAKNAKFNNILPERWQESAIRMKCDKKKQHGTGLIFSDTKRGEAIQTEFIDADIVLLTLENPQEGESIHIEGSAGYLYKIENSDFFNVMFFSYKQGKLD